MKIVICAKEVLDPDAVNNYALVGRLEIGEDGKTLTQSAVPRLTNAYDEQAMEAALRIKDAGVDATITVVSIGADQANLLKQYAALGAEEIVAIEADASALDTHATARILAAWIEKSGGADLVLCGRQASDDDQGVVPALVGEHLGAPVVTIARAVEVNDGTVRVTRVTPDGDQVVEASLPAVVTISNELGEPRYPSTAQTIKARRKKPTVAKVDDLGLDAAALAPQAELTRQFVPEVQGNCQFIEGGSATELAKNLIERLRADSLL